MTNLRTIILWQCLCALIACSKNFAQFDRQVDSLSKLISLAKMDTNHVKALNDLGGFMIRRMDAKQTLLYLNKADSLARVINYLPGILVANNRLGIYYQIKNERKRSQEFFLKALEVAKQTNNKKGQADVISNIGINYCNLGEYSKALDNYLAALNIRKSLKDPDGISSSMMSIANIYYLQYKYKMALECYEAIVYDTVNRPDAYFYAEAVYNAGLVYIQLKEYQKALSYFDKALQIDNEIGDKQGVALVYLNIGSVYMLEKNYTKALEYLEKALGILTEVDDKRNLSEAYGQMGQLYDSIKQPKKAEECFDKMLTISQEIGSLLNEKKAYHFFSDHYMEQKDYKLAYEYYVGFKSAEDSISRVANQQALAELQAEYETEKKENEIQSLKAQQSLQAAENRQKNLLIIASFVLLAVLSITIFLFYNRRQLKRKNELERKNYELERNALSAQMNPHFIFNSLASISGFVSENDKDRAIEYLGIFSRLIRHNLEQSRESLVGVSQEARMLRSYLHLEQLRHNHKFDFDITVEAAINESVAIPPMFVQPFVENAVLHGIAPKEGQGKIAIHFSLLNEEYIVCEVSDNGIGVTESKRRKEQYESYHRSLAMTITKERMEIMNAQDEEKIRIETAELDPQKDGTNGTRIRIFFLAEYI
jgi:tetratricopeptide (TPR) repeat protein